jgi:hypothetical protein
MFDGNFNRGSATLCQLKVSGMVGVGNIGGTTRVSPTDMWALLWLGSGTTVAERGFETLTEHTHTNKGRFGFTGWRNPVRSCGLIDPTI